MTPMRRPIPFFAALTGNPCWQLHERHHLRRVRYTSPPRVVAQFGSAFDWGSKGRGFKSRQPDSSLRSGRPQRLPLRRSRVGLRGAARRCGLRPRGLLGRLRRPQIPSLPLINQNRLAPAPSASSFQSRSARRCRFPAPTPSPCKTEPQHCLGGGLAQGQEPQPPSRIARSGPLTMPSPSRSVGHEPHEPHAPSNCARSLPPT